MTMAATTGRRTAAAECTTAAPNNSVAPATATRRERAMKTGAPSWVHSFFFLLFLLVLLLSSPMTATATATASDDSSRIMMMTGTPITGGGGAGLNGNGGIGDEGALSAPLLPLGVDDADRGGAWCIEGGGGVGAAATASTTTTDPRECGGGDLTCPAVAAGAAHQQEEKKEEENVHHPPLAADSTKTDTKAKSGGGGGGVEQQPPYDDTEQLEDWDDDVDYDEYDFEFDDEAEWDADELGPYQDREHHDYDAFMEVVRGDRAYWNEYMTNSTRDHGPNNADAIIPCVNEDNRCTSWAISGECDANPAYMKLHCAVACRTCDWLNVTERCRIDPNAIDAFGPGDLDKTMERIVGDPELVDKYGIEVISRPRSKNDKSKTNVKDDGMWLVVFHKFLSTEEAAKIRELGEQTGYAESQVFVKLHQGQAVSTSSQARTSWNTWCSNNCSQDPTHRVMIQRASNILHINETNFEDTQLLRYQSGQYYKRHNDFINAHLTLPMGPRILTFYVHLSDNVTGGGTHFPVLGATVEPKAGRAVLWPSILNDQPRSMDPRSDHEALPVHADSQNVKYGANIWVHQGDFKAAMDRACA